MTHNLLPCSQDSLEETITFVTVETLWDGAVVAVAGGGGIYGRGGGSVRKSLLVNSVLPDFLSRQKLTRNDSFFLGNSLQQTVKHFCISKTTFSY